MANYLHVYVTESLIPGIFRRSRDKSGFFGAGSADKRYHESCEMDDESRTK